MRHLVLSLLAALGFNACSAQIDIKTITPSEFAEVIKVDSSAVVLDVRTDAEFAEGHLTGAMHLDYLQEESFGKGIEALDNSKTYYIYCRSGKRSHGAAIKMQAKGLKVVDMKGGITAWGSAGLPTVTNDDALITVCDKETIQADGIVRLSKVEVFPEHLDEYLRFALEVGATSLRTEPGVITMYAMADKENPCMVTILETYSSQEAYKKHIASAHFQKYKQGTLHMVKNLVLSDQQVLNPSSKLTNTLEQ